MLAKVHFCCGAANQASYLKPCLTCVCALLEPSASVPESHWAREFDQGAGVCGLGGQGGCSQLGLITCDSPAKLDHQHKPAWAF